MAVIALAKIYPKPGQLKDLLAVLKPEAEYVKASEPTTDAYYFFVPEEEPDVLLGFEQYASKENLSSVHMQSEPFKAFVAGSESVTAKPFDLEFFEPADIGFLTREKFSTLQADSIFVFVVFFTAKPGKRDEVLERFKPLAKEVLESETTCYSYYFTKAIDNPDKIMILERYVTREASEVTHANTEIFKSTFSELMAADVLAEPPFMYRCAESGLGFLGRD